MMRIDLSTNSTESYFVTGDLAEGNQLLIGAKMETLRDVLTRMVRQYLDRKNKPNNKPDADTKINPDTKTV
jgi:hypothetical protein